MVFLRAPGDPEGEGMLELTYNWGVYQYDQGNAYGHVAYRIDSMDEVAKQLEAAGMSFSWGPGKTPDGRTRMAFVDDPDGYKIELLEYR